MIPPTMKLLAFLTLLLSLIIDGATAVEASIEGEVCKSDGVCFPTEDAAHKYYVNGVDIPIDFGEDQTILGEHWERTLEVVEKSKEYIRRVREEEEFEDVRDGCIVRNQLCSFWATIGECEVNPNYMKLQCAPSCQTWYVPFVHNACLLLVLSIIFHPQRSVLNNMFQ
jgi:hypothetical protein